MAEHQVARFLGYGADLAGASAGSAAEFFQLVPSGLGGLVAAGVASVVKEFSARQLSRREQVRISAAAAFAITRIRARLIAGFNPRSDGFLDRAAQEQSMGEQLLEAVLLTARDSFEERKVRHLGLFYANLVFADSASPEVAHFLLRQLDRITYRQLCLVALVGAKGSLDVEALRRPTHDTPELETLKREEMDLHSTDLGTMGIVVADGPWVDRLSKLGSALYDLAGLDEISKADISTVEAAIASLKKSS